MDLVETQPRDPGRERDGLIPEMGEALRCEQHFRLGLWLTSLDVTLPSVWEPWDSSSGTQVQEQWGAPSDPESHTPFPSRSSL